MNLHELLPILHNLSYADKLMVLQFLETEIASEEEETQVQEEEGKLCPIWVKDRSPAQESWFFRNEPGSLRSASEAFASARALLKQKREEAAQEWGEPE